MNNNNGQIFFKTGKRLATAWGIILTLFFMLNLSAEENVGKIIYSCGFEKKEGFGKPGSSIEGQKGWSLSTPELKYLVITDGTVVKSKWSGATEKQWLLLRSYKDLAITPAFDTSKYDEVKTTFSMRPAGLPKATSGHAGVIYFMDQNNKIMTRISLFRSDLNSGTIKMYSTYTDIDTGIPWEYLNKDTSLDFGLTIYQGARRWKLTMNGREATGSLMNSSKGTLAKIKFQGAICIDRHEIPTLDNIVVTGVKKRISGKVAVSKMVSVKNAKQAILNMRIAATAAAQKMDLYYYDAGIRVDIAKFDLNELVRQGKRVPPDLFTKINSTDKEMRNKWMALEKERNEIFAQFNKIPPKGKYLLEIEDLENGGAGESGWFGLRKAEIKWPDGTNVQLPIESFKNCVYKSRYAYMCTLSKCIFIYGKKSRTNKMITAFDIKTLPEGNPELILSALDDDKPGKVKIRITLNKQLVFEGINPFIANDWTEKSFSIQKNVFLQKSKNRKLTTKELMGKTEKYAVKIDEFKKWTNSKAKVIDDLTANLRKNIVYVAPVINNDWWKDGLKRGMCFEGSSVSFDSQKPMYHNPEYVAKSFRDANVDYVYGYLNGALQKTFLKEFEKVGLPYIQAGSWFIQGWNPKNFKYFSNREKLLNEIITNLGDITKRHNNVKAFALDEPYITEETNTRRGKLESPRIKELFGKYLEKHSAELKKEAVIMPHDKSKWGSVNYNNNRVLWLLRQLFKMELFADHLKYLSDGLKKENLLLFPIIMNHNHNLPEAASIASIGKKSPVFSTDLYNDGSVWEGFCMQLANNAGSGKALLTTGSGYSCKTPDNFRRSLGNGLIHADGILQWIELYCSKYRNPSYFWRGGGKKTLRDDRGRNMLGNWDSEYWDIQVDMHEKSKNLEKYFKNVESKANLVFLYSERTGVADSIKGAQGCRRYFTNSVNIYSDLMKSWRRPIDVTYVESLTPKKMGKYKLAIIADARVLSDKNMLLITKWVKEGGTLIATAETSLYSPWGKKRKNFAMAKLFGVDFTKTVTGAKKFKYDGMSVNYNPSKTYCKVSLAKGTKLLASWDNGDPAVTKKVMGKGQTLFITAKNIGARSPDNWGGGGLRGSSFSGMDSFLIKEATKILGKPVVRISGLPEGVEVQVRQARNGEFVLQMLDWIGERDIEGIKLNIKLPGKWEMFYPASPDEKVILNSKSGVKLKTFRIYDAIILQKI